MKFNIHKQIHSIIGLYSSIHCLCTHGIKDKLDDDVKEGDDDDDSILMHIFK